MTNFCKTKIRGEVYSFDHLQSHHFDIAVEDKTHRVGVHYTSHVFTEEISEDTKPDLFYEHNGECRAFCFERYEQSKILPQFIASHDWRYVYHSYRKNYFLVKNLTPHPYYIFFKANRIARKGDVSVVINIVSAYAKKTTDNIRSCNQVRTANPITGGRQKNQERKECACTNTRVTCQTKTGPAGPVFYFLLTGDILPLL